MQFLGGGPSEVGEVTHAHDVGTAIGSCRPQRWVFLAWKVIGLSKKVSNGDKQNCTMWIIGLNDSIT